MMTEENPKPLVTEDALHSNSAAFPSLASTPAMRPTSNAEDPKVNFTLSNSMHVHPLTGVEEDQQEEDQPNQAS
jgi:hypothetical protein